MDNSLDATYHQILYLMPNSVYEHETEIWNHLLYWLAIICTPNLWWLWDSLLSLIILCAWLFTFHGRGNQGSEKWSDPPKVIDLVKQQGRGGSQEAQLCDTVLCAVLPDVAQTRQWAWFFCGCLDFCVPYPHVWVCIGWAACTGHKRPPCGWST